MMTERKIEGRIRRIHDLLREKNIRLTDQRRLVVRRAAQQLHFTAEHLVKDVWQGKSAFKTWNDEAMTTPTEAEGYVIRDVDQFRYDPGEGHSPDPGAFSGCVGKFVRAKHIRTSQFWMTQPIIPNLLAAQLS